MNLKHLASCEDDDDACNIEQGVGWVILFQHGGPGRSYRLAGHLDQPWIPSRGLRERRWGDDTVEVVRQLGFV
jgi:hypothetical protein